jgi:hypothetical protein
MKLLGVAMILLAANALAACNTVVDTNPPRSAGEELLTSKAAEQAADNLNFQIQAGTRVYVDAGNLDGIDNKYAISTIRDRLARRGAHLIDKKTDAQIVVEIRSGALSIDQHQLLVGIPSFTIPIPVAGVLSFPEIALYKKMVRAGIAKFAATEYDPTGGLITSIEPQFGFSNKTDTVVLLLISWSSTDVAPSGSPVDGS